MKNCEVVSPIIAFRFSRPMKASELAAITRRMAQEQPGAKGKALIEALKNGGK
jgi:hypothetical protein